MVGGAPAGTAGHPCAVATVAGTGARVRAGGAVVDETEDVAVAPAVGVVTALDVEPSGEYGVSSAEAMLEKL